MNQQGRPRERWGTRIGVILAVTGSAVGLGNFLRFPGVAAEYGGGAFMIPYIIAFLIIGLPIAWVEWSMGRYGGSRGYNSAPGVFRAVCGNRRFAPYLGILGPLVPVVIYMYYVFVEAWCLGYAWNYLSGGLHLGPDVAAYDAFFASFVGMGENGASFTGDGAQALIFLAICFALNFFLIYRGLNKGIEWFCRFAMPALVVCALIVLVRVLTLGTPNPQQPEQSLINGLGYMWNPVHQAEKLAPADASVKRLVTRSTADAIDRVEQRDGLITALAIADPEAFGWTLEQSGWTKEAAEDGASPAETADAGPAGPLDALQGVWSKQKVSVSLDIAGRRATLIGPGSSRVSFAEPPAAIRSLLRMAPEPVAEVQYPTEAEDQYDTLQITDAAGFREALAVTGWEPRDEAGGVWVRSDSRLKIELQENMALIRAPAFWEMLANPEIWLAAAGQIFFSLSVGFGIIITYSSYMRRDDDVALSAVTAAAGNGWCEVALGGLIVIPATFVFLGMETVANPPGTFGMGFVSLPSVFNQMGQAGPFFGFLFFFLLFLAAVTSSLSMLQPAIAFLEEGLGVGRKASVALLGFITLVGCGFVVFFSKNLQAMDTLDFWVGSLCIYIMATIQVLLFGWVLGVDRGMEEIDRGAEVRIPRFIGFMIKYISPLFLLVIFVMWLINNLPGRLKAVADVPEGELPVVGMSLGLILVVLILFGFILARANQRWRQLDEPSGAAASPTEGSS